MLVRKHKAKSDLIAIKELQAQNLKEALSLEERTAEGFVTCVYDIKMLEEMCGDWSHIVAWKESFLTGYALCMQRKALPNFPILVPLHERLKSLKWKGKPIPVMDVAIIGQVCVAKGFRKQGLLQAMYTAMREQLKSSFQLLITEIDGDNIPSLRAHRSFGFEEIVRYKEQNGRVWVIVGVEL